MDYNRLAELCLPGIDKTPDYWEKQFPARELKKGAQVTRLAPSPTGFIHLGNLYGALADERIAHQSGGTFYLRIEDTDAKREVEGAVDIIINVLRSLVSSSTREQESIILRLTSMDLISRDRERRFTRLMLRTW